MWLEDDEVEAALRGDYAVNSTQEISWARIVAGATVLTLVALFAIGALINSIPA